MKEIPNPEYLIWKRFYRLLQGWITGTLSEEVLRIVTSLTTSREVWNLLINPFAQESFEKKFQLLQQVQVLQSANFASLNEYIRHFKNCCNGLVMIDNP